MILTEKRVRGGHLSLCDNNKTDNNNTITALSEWSFIQDNRLNQHQKYTNLPFTL